MGISVGAAMAQGRAETEAGGDGGGVSGGGGWKRDQGWASRYVTSTGPGFGRAGREGGCCGAAACSRR